MDNLEQELVWPRSADRALPEQGSHRDEDTFDALEASFADPEGENPDVRGLIAQADELRDKISALWGQVDPRPGRPDRYNRATDHEDALRLSDFFTHASAMIATLNWMLSELEASLKYGRAAADAADVKERMNREHE